MRTDFARQTFTGVEGLKLAADVGGRHGDPSVVLLHGGGQTRHSWGAASRELVRRGYFVVNFDARGHGDSEWARAAEDYSVPNMAADVRCVIASLPNLPVLVGASMGGLAALQAIGTAIEPIASALVLVDVVPRVEVAGAERILAFMSANPDGFASLDEAADAVAVYNPHRPRPRGAGGLAKNLRLHDDGRWRWHWDPQFVTRSRLDQVYSADGMLEMCRRIRLPVLLVRGMHSDIVSEEGIDKLRLHLPHVETINVSQAGHMIAGDKNDAFNRAMLDFLGRHMPSAR